MYIIVLVFLNTNLYYLSNSAHHLNSIIQSNPRDKWNIIYIFQYRDSTWKTQLFTLLNLIQIKLKVNRIYIVVKVKRVQAKKCSKPLCIIMCQEIFWEIGYYVDIPE